MPTQKRFAPLFLALALIVLAAPAAWAMRASESLSEHALKPGDILEDMILKGELNPAQAADLGIALGPDGTALHMLTAPVLVIEVFSMYCPYCQAEAPVSAELHRLIARRGLAGTIKMLGIGAGNTQFEVDTFRDKYALPFALVPDPDYVLHKACGEVGTPFFYILTKNSTDGRYVVRKTHLGQTDGPQQFLDEILKSTGKK